MQARQSFCATFALTGRYAFDGESGVVGDAVATAVVYGFVELL